MQLIDTRERKGLVSSLRVRRRDIRSLGKTLLHDLGAKIKARIQYRHRDLQLLRRRRESHHQWEESRNNGNHCFARGSCTADGPVRLTPKPTVRLKKLCRIATAVAGLARWSG